MGSRHLRSPSRFRVLLPQARLGIDPRRSRTPGSDHPRTVEAKTRVDERVQRRHPLAHGSRRLVAHALLRAVSTLVSRLSNQPKLSDIEAGDIHTCCRITRFCTPFDGAW